MAVETRAIDQARAEAFRARALGDVAGLTTTILAALGDRCGLFKNLDAGGPATSAELAARTGTDERYAREWLAGLSNAGYLTYEPATGRYALPAEHAPVLAQELGPSFFGGFYQLIIGSLPIVDRVAEAFRHGGGVPQSAYSESFYEGMDRFAAVRHENLLLQEWIPALPDVRAKLERGARVADVGCGRGRALIKLAGAFPESRYVGYDVYGPNVARAIANAELAGLGDRVRFELRDVAAGLPEAEFDLVTTFDVVHDAADPLGLLRAIRRALRPGGICVCLEIRCSERPEENAGSLGALFCGVSVLYCMTTSLANGGAGLGTVGAHEPKLRELCQAAGFGAFRRVPIESPFNALYEIRA